MPKALSKKATALIVVAALGAACAAHALYYYPQLPDRIALRYTAAGQADEWIGKKSFLALYLGAAGFIALVAPCLGLGLSRLPDSLINIPNKEYWLAPQRRRQAFDLIAQFLCWLAAATLALVLDLCNQLIQAQLGGTAALDHPVSSITLYLGFSAVWLYLLLQQFAGTSAGDGQ
jgi:uncharacterized membrane protein